MDINIHINIKIKIPEILISKSKIGRVYGWRPPTPKDLQRYAFLHPLKTFKLNLNSTPLPEAVDLRSGKYKMPPIYDQLSCGSCHDDQTEILTENGWKLFKDVQEGEKLATVNPETDELIYEKPVRLIKLEYKGNMIVGKHAFIDFKVTPDHKMLVRKWNEKKRTLEDFYDFVNAEDMGWYCGLMNRVEWKGDEQASDYYTIPGVEHKRWCQREDKILPMGLWLKFLGIYLAEGCFGAKGFYRIQLAACKETEKIYIRNILTEMGLNYNERVDRIVFENKQIYTELIRLGLERVKAPYKFVPEFVFHQKAEHIRDFLNGHFEGDGCESVNGHHSHYTSSTRLADDLQRLIFLSGEQSGLYIRGPRTSTMKDGRIVRGKFPEYRVSVCKNMNMSISRKKNITEEWYDGYVYCAEVPTYHTLVTRRNHKILISGNCVGNVIAAILEFNELNRPSVGEDPKNSDAVSAMRPSRLFIYYFGRLKGGITNIQEDSGMMIYDGVGAVSIVGYCPEEVPIWNIHNIPKEVCWPYDVDKFAEKPPMKSILFARKHKGVNARRIDGSSLSQLKSALAHGNPIAFGMILFESFESEELRKTGIMKMPNYEKESIIGGHALLLTHYDDTKKIGNETGAFGVRNSWGETWGDGGYFYAPYSLITNPSICMDFWIIPDNKNNY